MCMLMKVCCLLVRKWKRKEEWMISIIIVIDCFYMIMNFFVFLLHVSVKYNVVGIKSEILLKKLSDIFPFIRII